MSEIASRAQLRMAYVRWALLTVPAILLLGFLSYRIAGGGAGDPWYEALAKPPANPSDRVFPIAWTLLYVLMGLAFALVLAARGARRRGIAIALFLVQLALNMAWAPLFFGAHQVSAALALLVVIFVVAAAASALFALIRPIAGALMLPYLLWLLFAGYLNAEIARLNPDAATLAPATSRTQISL